MILKTTTNGEVRKTEYPANSVEGLALLAQIPNSLYPNSSVSMVGDYTASDYITLYFSPKTSFNNFPVTEDMFSMKYNTKDGSHYFKTYEVGNTTTNNIDGAIYTGRFSNSNKYTLYIYSKPLPLGELLLLKEGFISKTYDENHNELFESLYISNVSS
jgi:hypothetical protein